jgi:tRNA (cytidine32/uridine32-2'-O)-methyltransferase
MNLYDNIRIVLVATSHPGNIGATARAMKVMGLNHLTLVTPKQFPHPQAEAMASGADDILANAKVVVDLEEALQGCHFVLGTTARKRNLAAPLVDARQGAELAMTESQQGAVAILFGEERTGLTNDQLDKCHGYINIPTADDYASLNLAQAVQVMAYELRMTMPTASEEMQRDSELATSEQMEAFYQHLYDVMVLTQFIDPQQPKRIMPRLRRLFNRARLEQKELHILRGILKSVGEYSR